MRHYEDLLQQQSIIQRVQGLTLFGFISTFAMNLFWLLVITAETELGVFDYCLMNILAE